MSERSDFPHGSDGAGPERACALSCAGFGALLAELERTGGGVSGSHASGSHASPDAALVRLGSHVVVCFACRTRYRERLGVVRGLCALRVRAVPAGLLDGFCDRVLAETSGPRPGLHAGGMSVAFLDAPRSLSQWRWTAVAASVLVFMGAGLLASGRLAWRDGASERGPNDGVIELRDALLDRFDARRADDAPASVVQPVDLPGRGSSDYWGWVPRSDRPIIRPVPPAERSFAGK